MKVIIVVLVAVGSVSGFGEWTHGLKVRFGLGQNYFKEVPRTASRAEELGWTLTERPSNPLPELFMYCESTRTICALYDDTEFVAGLQIALAMDDWTPTPTLNMNTMGFTNWTIDGRSYWSISQYFVSAETLTISPEERKASIREDNPKTLREDAVWLAGFDGELLKVPMNRTEMIDTGFTIQQCIPAMGRHHYYKMDSETVCDSDNLLSWFTLTDRKDIVGTGFAAFGNLTTNASFRNWVETDVSFIVPFTVPNAPQCLYDVSDQGLITIHVFYVENPIFINCIF